MAANINEIKKEVAAEEHEQFTEIQELNVALILIVSEERAIDSLAQVINTVKTAEQRQNVIYRLEVIRSRILQAQKEIKDALKWDERVVKLAATIESQLRSAVPKGELTAEEESIFKTLKNYEKYIQRISKLITKDVKSIEQVVKALRNNSNKVAYLTALIEMQSHMKFEIDTLRRIVISVNNLIVMERRGVSRL